MSFKNVGYELVRNAISSELRDFVTQYALFDEMQNFKSGDKQTPNAHHKYADPAMESMLLHLHSKMEEVTQLKLYPTYSYFRVYRKDDDLKVHTDRPSCEISSTLCFNYSYDDSKYKWPIYMSENPIELNPGDMLIYRGCDLKHWRDVFECSEEEWQVQGFFHYVDANGPYADYAFDRRGVIGEIDYDTRMKRFLPSKPYIKYL